MNKVIVSPKQRLFTRIRFATLLAVLVSVVPLGIANAASATSAGTVPVTLTTPDSGVAGQPMAFTVSAINTTSSPAEFVQLVVWFPRSTQLIAPLPNPDTCGRAGGPADSTTFACNFGTVAPGATVSIAFNLVPASATFLPISARNSATVDGVSQINNTSTQVPLAPAPADLQVTGSASTGSPARGANFSYTFQVRNNGSEAGYSTTLADTVPAGEVLVQASSNSGSCSLSGISVNCNLGNIAPGAQVLVTLNVTAPTLSATLTNTASASSTNGDTRPGNNSYSVTVQVR